MFSKSPMIASNLALESWLGDQQAQLGVLGAGRAGVQLAEFQTGSDRDRAALQAQLLSQGFGQGQAAAQQAEQTAIEGTPALMNSPIMDPSKNPQILEGQSTPPPEE